MAEAKQSSKISEKDLEKVASYIYDEYSRRKKSRRAEEQLWDEIDRQVRMEPDIKYKRTGNNKKDRSKNWMPEIELQLQAQTLEVILSDVEEFMFPDDGPFFRVKAYAPDDFLSRFQAETPFVVGSEVDAPSVVTTDNINDYAHGFTEYALCQFNHKITWSLICASAIKYGLGVGRVRVAAKSTFIHDTASTFNRSSKLPVLVPMDIRNVFPDENFYKYMANGAIVGGSVIYREKRKLTDILVTAKKDNNDKTDFSDGGWLLANLKNLRADNNGFVEYIEYEGDLVFPTTEGDEAGDTVLVPNVIVTVLCGEYNNEPAKRVVRVQYSEMPWPSYIFVPYMEEKPGEMCASSPLKKGYMLQKTASESLNRYMQAAILDTEPVIQYSPNDRHMIAQGGPQVFPGASWPSTADIVVHNIGDPTALIAGYTTLVSQYQDVTGVNAPRLGAQTISHTTAFAKEQEIERGTRRTKRFVRSVLSTPMEKWLVMCYFLAKKELGEQSMPVYMEAYKSYVNVRGDLLPDYVKFVALGSLGPSDDVARQQQRQAAIMTAMQVNNLAVQMGLAQPLNYDAITRQLLSEGGITDVDKYTVNPQGATGGPALPGAGGQPIDAGPAALILQNLAGGG